MLASGGRRPTNGGQCGTVPRPGHEKPGGRGGWLGRLAGPGATWSSRAGWRPGPAGLAGWQLGRLGNGGPLRASAESAEAPPPKGEAEGGLPPAGPPTKGEAEGGLRASCGARRGGPALGMAGGGGVLWDSLLRRPAECAPCGPLCARAVAGGATGGRQAACGARSGPSLGVGGPAWDPPGGPGDHVARSTGHLPAMTTLSSGSVSSSSGAGC